MFSSMSLTFRTPRARAVPGISCITPTAPFPLTASESYALSVSATASASLTSTPSRAAIRPTANFTAARLAASPPLAPLAH